MMVAQPGGVKIARRESSPAKLNRFDFCACRSASMERNAAVPRLLFQLIAIVVFAFTLYFVWDFSQRVVTSIRLTQSEQQLETQVARAKATQTALFDKKKQVQSDTYVEARVRGWHWAKDGETVVVTQITPAPPPAVNVPLPPLAPEIPWWQQILNFLFGS
jgi:cell division protein FtsB